MKIAKYLSALACTCLLAVGAAHAASPDETLKTLPAPVQKTIKAQSQQAVLFSIDQKAKNGAVRYKVIMKFPDGKQRRLFVDPTGKLLRLKNDVDTAALPAGVHKTVDMEAQGGKIIRSTKVTQDTKVQYEVEMEVKGQKKVVLLDPAGKLVKTEEVIVLESAPAPVKSEIEKNVGHGKLLKVEAITEAGKPTIYEAQYEADAHKSEIKLAADGKVLERE